jgi:5'-deoxynucleotidase YfbR-like HD superfamily hydrolase
MAKDIKEVTRNELKEFEPLQLKADVDSYNSLREDVASENQRISTLCQTLEKDRGYNIQGFKKAAQYAKKTREGAVDELRTFFAALEAIGLYPLPTDLVDQMEGDGIDGEVLPPNGKGGKKAVRRGARADAH